MTYLGHVISAKGIHPDPSKTSAVAEYPTPKDAKQLKQFLGFAYYYQHSVKQYATIAEPLHKVLRGKPNHFTWDERCSEAFETLKTQLINPPILALPNFNKPIILYTDASDVALGGVLGQIQDGTKCVVAYWSHQLKPLRGSTQILNKRPWQSFQRIRTFIHTCMDIPLPL